MKNCRKTVLYTYINSGNHGCEAIARSTYDILGLEENENYIFSSDAELDKDMGLDKKWTLKQIVQLNGIFPISSIFCRLIRKLKIDTDALWKYQYKELLNLFDEDTLAISTGGDVYCYDGSDWLTYLNREILKKGARTVLWGCSIESKRLSSTIVEDLKRYTLITVRESYTLNSLREKGITDNVRLFPDPAFVLESKPKDIFEWDKMGKILGINLSNYVVKSESIYNMFRDFIRHIISETEYSVVLIPHVFWKRDNENDLGLLSKLYEDVGNKDRVYLVDKEYNCMELKYIISKCDIYMGARTHSVIAAYSSIVPALAFSYSIKSRGIAKDIFGEEENYVMSVDDSTGISDLYERFMFLSDHADEIKDKLNRKMDEYGRLLKEEKSVMETLFDK